MIFEQYNRIHLLLRYQRLEQTYLLRLNFAYNIPDDNPNKNNLIQSLKNEVDKIHQSLIQERNLLFNSPLR